MVIATKRAAELPHGPSFRLVDTVTMVSPFPQSATAEYTYTGLEQWAAADHFPGNPIMPGMMILEAMAQAAIQIALIHPDLKDKNFIFTGVERAEFSGLVKPNTTLTLHASVFWTEEGRRGFADCLAQNGDKTVATARIQFAVMRKRGR